MTDYHAIPLGARRAVLAYLGLTGLVVALMMLGLLMRLSQGDLLPLPPALFYQVMTAHGIGMVGIAAIGGAAVMWYFLNRYLDLSLSIFIANLVLFLLGVVLILGGIFIGGFAAAWTFLYPLPAQSQGAWSDGAAAVYLAGVLIVGVGFLLLFLDVGRALLARYGSLGRALGWPQLFGREAGDAPPPAVVAGAMVTAINIPALVVGAAILAMTLINLYFPGFALDPLLAKNLIFFFGHVFINSTIYMAVIAVYEILPRYTSRPWKAGRVFLAAFTASLFMVLSVYPHHLLMDFAMPEWMLWMGQIVSYLSGLPVLLVTAFGTLSIVNRSGIRWDLSSGLLFLAVFGWAAGVLPAIIDATIVVNRVMHNTMWVPGHFHFYLLLGMLAMVFGFMCYLRRGEAEAEDRG
ncbi:MAG: cbb3-type cytochrome c oxidase subunit I, partial [Phycisphaeraceae bacterium]|nr:cbb3-type cytochrome c oxidase subunit I [Phycisphaeraceae bacterium]